jgi:ElaB/YqjD/DUF883 family membrane-anchored ribosome-binding protein
MGSLSKFRDDVESDLSDQIASLRKEIASLRSSAKKQSARAYDDASDTLTDLIESLLSNTKGARKELYSKARLVNEAARDNPVTTAAVGLAAIGLLAALLFSRR